ncbi:MAG: CotH kinase family protein [Flavobacteriales bacterium]|nr:CotH kinase family protein [Flavobacteriales bacterium]
MSLPLVGFGQIDGDNIFSVDQVISIELDFPQGEFWQELVANYEAEENLYIPANLTLTDVTGTYSLDSVGVRLKGNSSYMHPGDKKSFKIDFNRFISGLDYDGLKKLNFSNGFKDPTCMREKLFFDVCRAAGVAAPRASFAEVTLNGEPWGFYTVVEQIDDQFLDWNIQEDDGNLFKAGDNFGGGPPDTGANSTAADLAYYGADQAAYADRYELKTNEDENDWSDLLDLIDFLNNTTLDGFAAGIDARVEVDAYLRSAALNMLFSNLDSYTGSARNYYIYHNQDTGLWEWIKWDGNEAFGRYTNDAGNMETLDVDYSDSPRPLLERMLEHPDLYQRYLLQVCELTTAFFNEDYMFGRIDAAAALVAPYVYADANKMYSNADFDTNIEADLGGGGGGMGGGAILGLKPFVSNRTASVAGQIDCAAFVGLEETEWNGALYPNPVSSELHISWEGAMDVAVVFRNVLGQALKKVVLHHADRAVIPMAGWTPGTYVVSLEHDGVALTRQQIVVQ